MRKVLMCANLLFLPRLGAAPTRALLTHTLIRPLPLPTTHIQRLSRICKKCRRHAGLLIKHHLYLKHPLLTLEESLTHYLFTHTLIRDTRTMPLAHSTHTPSNPKHLEIRNGQDRCQPRDFCSSLLCLCLSCCSLSATMSVYMCVNVQHTRECVNV